MDDIYPLITIFFHSFMHTCNCYNRTLYFHISWYCSYVHILVNISCIDHTVLSYTKVERYMNKYEKLLGWNNAKWKSNRFRVHSFRRRIFNALILKKSIFLFLVRLWRCKLNQRRKKMLVYVWSSNFSRCSLSVTSD